MNEILDIYDSNKIKTSKKYVRGSNNLKQNEYVIVVEIIILNSKNEILLSQRSENKKINPLKWETTQGSVKSGENSEQAVQRELLEELGIEILKEKLNYLKTLKDEKEHIFKDMFWIKEDIELNEIKFIDGEVIDVKWVNLEEIKEMYQQNQLADNMSFNSEYINKIILSGM